MRNYHGIAILLALAAAFLLPASAGAQGPGPDQDLPICPSGPDRSTEEPPPPGDPRDEIVACRVDPRGDIPAPLGISRGPFLRPPGSYQPSGAVTIESVGTHLLGYEMNNVASTGLRAYLAVSDPAVPHSSCTNCHAAFSRILESNAATTVWIEAGWVELQNQPDKQYIYWSDSTKGGVPQLRTDLPISPGQTIRVRLQFINATQRWQAHLWWNNQWMLLREVYLSGLAGPAPVPQQMVELYIPDGNHWGLPNTWYTNVYVKFGDTWNVWGDQYRPYTNTEFETDPPYDVHTFNYFYNWYAHKHS